MIKKVSHEEFYFKNEELGFEALNGIEIYYGNFSQTVNTIKIHGITYEIFHRETVELPGSVKNPLYTLLKRVLSVKTVRKIQSLHPDAVLYEFLGTERLVDPEEPNPEGIFILKFEMALAVKPT
ncbi:MAG: hypothetical protein ACFFD4_31605 [Candidatus Odinarchaeota archaeon]